MPERVGMGLKVGRFWDWVLLEEEVVVVGWPERGGRLKGEMEEGAVVLVLVLVLAVLLVVFVEEEKEDEAEEEQPPHSPHVRGNDEPWLVVDFVDRGLGRKGILGDGGEEWRLFMLFSTTKSTTPNSTAMVSQMQLAGQPP